MRHSEKYGKKIKIIYPGEFYVSEEDEIISTVLGSCVSLCLYDTRRNFSGMNHFMLPGRITNYDLYRDKTAKYGINAINVLLQTMEQHGSQKDDLIAKLFGGSNVLRIIKNASSIPEENVRLAKLLMEMEDIQIAEVDAGGIYSRKILMEVKNGKVYSKKIIRNDLLEKIRNEEINYYQKIADSI